jgi:hypothetical protein
MKNSEELKNNKNSMRWNISTFQNKEPTNPFSPIFKYHILEFESLEYDYIKSLEDFILKIEPEIIEKYSPASDGNTGLGLDSLTSRFSSVNFFKFSEFDYFKIKIKESIKVLLQNIGQEDFNETIYGQCWVNVMRTNQEITKHQHATNNHSFLSGHLVVKPTIQSYTYYCNRYNTEEKYFSKNTPGKITLFPSWLEHGTSKVQDGVRITVAFDLLTETGYQDLVKNGIDFKDDHWEKIIL